MGDELRASDLDAVREQLGRDPSVPFSVVARCGDGHPLVIRNRPLDAQEHPFPTIYWLTCPAAVAAVSRIEADGWIDRLEGDPEVSRELADAHARYAAERGEVLAGSEAWGGVGGTRTGVKCLHAHYAYHLAGGDDPVGRWTAARVEPVHPDERPGRVAAIDQGTNSTRLLVLAPVSGSDPIELARDMVITRLGRGVDETGRLARASVDRTLEVIGRFARRARALHAERIRLGATSAVRDAANAETFLGPARELVGSDPEVLDGEREAQLSFLGGTHGLDPAGGPFAVVDIGGGSTEFVVGREPGRAQAAISTQLGEAAEVAQRLGVKAEEVVEMETRLSGRDLALEGTPEDGEEAFAPIDYLADSRYEPTRVIEGRAYARLQDEGLQNALAGLDPRSRRIVEARWLHDGEAATLHELAAEFDVSAERIRQIEAKALQKMRGLLTA